mmetsp:Transcript_58356/g.147969  ORF Transcript_58356/g.147969 Transcript_58356/m.147969 type:complete len:221 (+) Transcript_58356:347-1009(+)
MRQVIPIGSQARAINSRELLVVLRLEDVHVAGDCNCGFEVVSSNHHHSNAGFPGSEHRLGNTIAVGVDRSHQTDKPQVLPASRKLLIGSEILVLCVERHASKGPCCDGEHTKCLRRVRVDDIQDRLLVGLRHGGSAAVLHQLLCAEVQDEVRCALAYAQELGALGQGHSVLAHFASTRHICDGEHHLAGRREGNLQHTFVILRDILIKANFPCSNDQRCL